MDQIILACDDKGEFLEYIPKETGHTGKGRRHLAITVLLYNSKGQILLQRRKHEVFDNIWDFTASTHPLHKDDGSDETLEEATRRALNVEWGISPSSFKIKRIGAFNYFAKYGKYCENEHCTMVVGEYNGEVNMNPDVAYEYKWVKKEKFLKDIKKNPKNYTPWANRAVDLLKKVVLA